MNIHDDSARLLKSQHLDALVSALYQTFGFDTSDDTYEAVATVILHAPPDMGQFTLDYVGNRVAKMMANKVAYEKIQELKAKREDTLKASQASGVPSDGTSKPV